MRITFAPTALSARQRLHRSLRDLNRTTNDLLENAGVRRADSAIGSANLQSAAAADAAAISSGITAANATVSMNQTAEAALESIHGKLSAMRDLIEDVRYGALSQEQIEAKAAEYETYAGEIETLMEETTYDDRVLLSGRDPVARFNVDPALDIDLDSLADDAEQAGSVTMISVAEARNDLDLKSNAATRAASDLADHATEYIDYDARLTTADAALRVLEDVTRQFIQDVVGAKTAQANVSPMNALRILS